MKNRTVVRLKELERKKPHFESQNEFIKSFNECDDLSKAFWIASALVPKVGMMSDQESDRYLQWLTSAGEITVLEVLTLDDYLKSGVIDTEEHSRLKNRLEKALDIKNGELYNEFTRNLRETVKRAEKNKRRNLSHHEHKRMES